MPKRKIVISEFDNIAAVFEDDRAVEFIIHRGDTLLGDVYLATVENILPSIDAAFVNVGGDKMGFLHSSDVPGRGDLKERLQPKQQLVVQVMKEPTGHKGPRVTTNISLPGRFLVMMPESKGISISRKIADSKERSRLKSVVSLMKPPGVGIIIRTEGNEQKESDIQEDFETLLERWQNIVSMADTAKPPTLLYRDQDLLYRVIREAVNEDVTELIVDSAFGQQRAQQLLQNWNLDKGINVKQYSGAQPILVGTGVDKEIRQALQTKVPLPSGGYLYIQPTEALHVVDVNSGKFTSLASQAETIKLTNLESCKEIARQLRLRNIGGMIVVDFIDMESRADQLTVLETFENELSTDKAKPQIGQLSDLGLVEMTRHRQGQSLNEIFTKRCHVCSGTGTAIDEQIGGHVSHEPQEGRGRGGQDRYQRNKLPMKQTRNQQVPRLPIAQARPAVAPLLELKDLRHEYGLGSKDAGVPASSANGTPLLMGGESKANIPLDGTLADYFEEKTYRKLGIRLAHVTKLAYAPPVANSILSRINPKANDIVTLVNTITAEPAIPLHERGDDRYNRHHDTHRMMSEGGEDDEDDTEEAEHGGVAVKTEKPRRPRWMSDDTEETEGARLPADFDADEDDESPEEEEAAPRRGRALKKAEEGTADEDVEDDDLLEDEDTDTDEADDTDDGDGEESAEPEVAASKKPRRRGRPPKRGTKKR